MKYTVEEEYGKYENRKLLFDAFQKKVMSQLFTNIWNMKCLKNNGGWYNYRIASIIHKFSIYVSFLLLANISF